MKSFIEWMQTEAQMSPELQKAVDSLGDALAKKVTTQVEKELEDQKKKNINKPSTTTGQPTQNPQQLKSQIVKALGLS